MAKKKRKSSGKKKPFGAIRAFFGFFFSLIFKLLPPVIAVAGIVFLFLTVKNALYADFNLNVDKIIVSPADSLAADDRQALETKWIGKNILAVDLDGISRELQRRPEIKQAKVSRILPALLKVEIEKRKPMAFVQFAPKGSFAIISDDGVVLDVVKEKNASLVVVEAFGVGQKEPQLGSEVKLKGFTQAMKFLTLFWEHPLARQETITRINLDHIGNLTITLGVGPDIRLGREPVERLSSLDKIVPLLLGESRVKIEYIDLQFDNVIVKRKK